MKSLTNSSSGVIEINNITNIDGLSLTDEFTSVSNSGIIRIGNISAIKRMGIFLTSLATFNNQTTGVLHIDNVTGVGASQGVGIYINAGFTNSGQINLGTNFSLIQYGMYIQSPGTLINQSAGTIQINNVANFDGILLTADHLADRPVLPWLTWVALGACHAPHPAPPDLIRGYDAMFSHGWDVEREQRMAKQKSMGVVPQGTKMPNRNDGVKAWEEHSGDERRVFTRLQSAFAGMLDHADRHLARLVAFLDKAGVRDNTLIIVMSDNGASQGGGPLGMLNAMGPYNFRWESMEEKKRLIDQIGGPKSHSNFPLGWAMAANTPLRRYKQNTHGGGIRDPLVISWPAKISARGELRHQFAHASIWPRRCSTSSASPRRPRSTA